MHKKEIRTRFAPSPTGYMHIGNLRTALYSYLFAKKSEGKFILRIEDTDQERFLKGACEIIYETLNEAGLKYDEGPDVGGPFGPYIQSERNKIGIYTPYAELLIERGCAYRCFCGKEALEEQRNVNKASGVKYEYDGRCSRLSQEEIAAKLKAGTPYIVRQKIPAEGETPVIDSVYGRINIKNSELDDQVLIKSDGMPTYNFANVIDDHLMGITHVIRGSEFLNSTAKYNLLYKGFGWEIPEYVHCLPIMKDENNKLSKRHGDASFEDFIEKGFLKDAVLNYIALLGWSPGGEKEIFTLPELIAAFDIKGISKGKPPIFDIGKLTWFNEQYIKAMTLEEFHSYALKYIKACVKREIDTLFAARVLKNRCKVFSEIPGYLDFIDNLPEYSPELFINKKAKTDIQNSADSLKQTLLVLEKINEWRWENIHNGLLDLVKRSGFKNDRIFWPLRIAVTGKLKTEGGGSEYAYLLGREESLSRIKKALKKLAGFSPEKTVTDPKSAAKGIKRNAAAVNIKKTKMPSDKAVTINNKKRIGEKEIKSIAALAKLDLGRDPDELSENIRELNKLKEIIDGLKKIETRAGAYPLNTDLLNTFRDDAAKPSISRADALANAPSVKAGCVSVPKMMEREK